MTRRELLLGPAAAIAAPLLRSQQPYRNIRYRDYARCLPDYLRSLAAGALAKRNRAIASLTTPEALQQRQQWVRRTFWELVGGEPARTPLNPVKTGAFERPAYLVEKIVFESRPKFFIPANVYIPRQGKPPYPGVLFQMGHSNNGKAAATYQKCCQGLVQLGFLVVAFDPMGQGERTYYPGPDGLTRLDSADDEHTMPGRQMLLMGDTSTRLQVWDAVRSLDYLESHPLVDPKRLASTGQSGGATLTMLLAAVDDRLAAAAVSSGNTENFACAEFDPPGSTDDAEQNLIGSGRLGFDRWDLLYPLAPKPLLILVSARDFFGTYSPRYLASGWEEYQKLHRTYTTLGHPERLHWADTPLPHGLSYALRVQIYNWLRRWLKDEAVPIEEEPPVTVESDQTLWASASGSVVTSFGSETPFTLLRQRASEVSTPQPPSDIGKLIGVDPPPDNARASILGRVRSARCDIEALEVPSEKAVTLPAWLFLPRASDPSKPLLILVEPQGRNSHLVEGTLSQDLAAAGIPVCTPDLRGIGDLAPEFPRGAAEYARNHQGEEAYAWASLILGRPLLSQRVADLWAMTKALRAHPAGHNRRLVIAARGSMTVPALFLMALEGSVDSLFLGDGLVSFRRIVETEDYRCSFANFLPRVLLHADLPQLAATVAPRRIRLSAPVDATGNAMAEAAARALYRDAPNVEIVFESRWDLSAFSSL